MHLYRMGSVQGQISVSAFTIKQIGMVLLSYV